LRYQVILALTGAQGLEFAITERFDLVMLDAWLPDMNGIDLCRKIRQSNPSTPILFYSAAAYGADIEAGIAAGAQDYITKPADLDQLELTIRRYVEGDRS
jgi:two-component system response regulator ArlR